MSQSAYGVTVVHGGQDSAPLQHLQLINVDMQVTIVDSRFKRVRTLEASLTTYKLIQLLPMSFSCMSLRIL